MHIAVSVIESLDDGVLLWQVACEYLAVSRKLESQDYSYREALEDIEDLRLGWDTILPVWGVMGRVLGLRSKGFSHWDALLIRIDCSYQSRSYASLRLNRGVPGGNGFLIIRSTTR